MQSSSTHRQLLWLRIHAFASTIVIALLAAHAIWREFAGDDVLRARGLVITDPQGRDRILIGSPVPDSKARMRTDIERVRREWAPQLGGDAYMQRFVTYDHEARGMLFLDENGYDRIVIGDGQPDPNTGKRVVEATGFTFNDDRGFEVGGLGMSKTGEGGTRVVLGMDDTKVGEALHLFVLEDGTKGVRIAYEGGQMFVGRARPGNIITGRDEELAGVVVIDEAGKVLWEQNALAKK